MLKAISHRVHQSIPLLQGRFFMDERGYRDTVMTTDFEYGLVFPIWSLPVAIE